MKSCTFPTECPVLTIAYFQVLQCKEEGCLTRLKAISNSYKYTQDTCLLFQPSQWKIIQLCEKDIFMETTKIKKVAESPFLVPISLKFGTTVKKRTLNFHLAHVVKCNMVYWCKMYFGLILGMLELL